MKRRLSSLATPYYRFTPPVLLIFGFGWIILHVNEVNFAGAVVYTLVLGVACIFSLRLKKVHLSLGRLYVSDYFKRTAIDPNDIAQIESSSLWRGWQPRTIKLTFDVPSRFGSEIVFIPRGLGFFASEVVDEIRAAKHAT
jgi:hypothetical protein